MRTYDFRRVVQLTQASGTGEDGYDPNQLVKLLFFTAKSQLHLGQLEDAANNFSAANEVSAKIENKRYGFWTMAHRALAELEGGYFSKAQQTIIRMMPLNRERQWEHEYAYFQLVEARLLLSQQRLAEATVLLKPAYRTLQRFDDQDGQSAALQYLLAANTANWNPEYFCGVAERLLAYYRLANHYWEESRTLFHMARHAILQCDTATAMDCTRGIQRLVSGEGLSAMHAGADMLEAFSAFEDGNYDAVLEHAGDFAALAEDYGHAAYAVTAHVERFLACLMLAKYDRAVFELTVAPRYSSEILDGITKLLPLFLGVAAAYRGNITEARRMWSEIPHPVALSVDGILRRQLTLVLQSVVMRHAGQRNYDAVRKLVTDWQEQLFTGLASDQQVVPGSSDSSCAAGN